MRKICVINQKGGVAKTTSVINIASGLARQNKKVLIIDLDPQGNAGKCLNAQSTKDIYDFLVESADSKECITKLDKNLDIITSRETLTKAELILVGEQNRENILKKKLKKVKEYDYLIIDCPPSLGLLSQNAMLYADEAFIPVSCDILGFDALKKMVIAIRTLNNVFDHSLLITKIIPTMYDRRNKVCREMYHKMRNEFYELVSDPIRVNSKLKEAPREGKCIFSYDNSSRGAQDYFSLVRHVMQDEQKIKNLMETKARVEEIQSKVSVI